MTTPTPADRPAPTPIVLRTVWRPGNLHRLVVVADVPGYGDVPAAIHADERTGIAGVCVYFPDGPMGGRCGDAGPFPDPAGYVARIPATVYPGRPIPGWTIEPGTPYVRYADVYAAFPRTPGATRYRARFVLPPPTPTPVA